MLYQQFLHFILLSTGHGILNNFHLNNMHLILFCIRLSLALLCMLLFILILLGLKCLMCRIYNVGVRLLIRIIVSFYGIGMTGIRRALSGSMCVEPSMGSIICISVGSSNRTMILLGLQILFLIPRNTHFLSTKIYKLFSLNLEILTDLYPAYKS